MTLNVNDVRDEYTATASQTIFNYTFKIYSSTDLDVFVTPSGQACTSGDLTTAYTVAGVGAEAGGSITLTTGATVNDLVTIVSSIPSSRTTDYQNNGDFRPDTVNDDFDRTVSLVKQAIDKSSRALTFPDCEQGVNSLTLPPPVANSFIRWNSGLTGMENFTFSTTGIVAEVSVDDFPALRTLTSSSYTDGQVIIPTDDGIGGIFIVKTGAVTDNGGTLIVFTDDSNRYAERLFYGPVSVDWFGAASGNADVSSEINAAFAYAATTGGKSIEFSPKVYNITNTVGRTTAGAGGFVEVIYGNRAIVEYTGTSLAFEFAVVDTPSIYDLRIFRDTVGVNLWADLQPGGTYEGTVGISAPKMRSKVWMNIFIEGFGFGVDQNVDQNIDSGYRSSRCNIYNIDLSGCLFGWNIKVANGTAFHTNFAWHKLRYAGDSVKDGATRTGTAFRGFNDGSPTPDQYPRAMVFYDCVIEQALYAIDINANGKGNALHSPYMEDNTNNVFFRDNPGNPNAQWAVFGDQDESAEILTNPDYTTQQHIVLTSGRDIRLQSEQLTVINNEVGIGRAAPVRTTVGVTINSTTGLTDIVGSATAINIGTTAAGDTAVQEYYRNSTNTGVVRYTSGDDLRYTATNDFEVACGTSQSVKIETGSTERGRFDTGGGAGTTCFLLYDVDNGSLERVTVGIADSGGSGFKVLRIPN